MQHAQNRWHLDGGEHRPWTDFAPPVPAVHPAPVPETACRRTYDHRLRELAYHAGDPGVAQRLGVPRSTARPFSLRLARRSHPKKTRPLWSVIPASKTSTLPSMPFLVSVAYVGCLPRSKSISPTP